MGAQPPQGVAALGGLARVAVRTRREQRVEVAVATLHPGIDRPAGGSPELHGVDGESAFPDQEAQDPFAQQPELAYLVGVLAESDHSRIADESVQHRQVVERCIGIVSGETDRVAGGPFSEGERVTGAHDRDPSSRRSRGRNTEVVCGVRLFATSRYVVRGPGRLPSGREGTDRRVRS